MSRILIVDDTDITRKMLREFIESGGHEIVAEGTTGQEGFELYKELSPDLVFMDMTMPVANGIEGVRLIREFDSDAKIIMCTAVGQKELVIEAIKMGALDYIKKPFDEKRVLSSIDKILK